MKFSSSLKTKILFCTSLLAASCEQGQTVDSRPNIIYIMVDDMGYADISIYGRTDYQTPAIDSFIRQGVKFNNAYAAAPVCTPTRVAFMTGRYPARNETGLREPLTMGPDDVGIGLSPGIPTISSILKANGYETALFGKWHLGVNPESSPLRHGFDHFFGFTAGAADYVDHRPVNPRYAGKLIKGNRHILFEDEEPVERPGYLTDLITEYAVNFINEDHSKPFFISLQYNAPHWPFQPPGADPLPDTADFPRSGTPEPYAAMMRNLDENLRKVFRAVKEASLDESTMIIFTSDNGGERYSDMGPYKGGKMQLWEGGIKVPAAVRWPGIISTGTQSNQPVITMDWTVTILDAAMAEYADTLSFDGISLLPQLKDGNPVVPREFYWRTSNRVRADAYRDGDWKYLRTGEGEFLFNLAEDPYENHNLKEEMTEKFNMLKAEFLEKDKEMLEPLIIGSEANR